MATPPKTRPDWALELLTSMASVSNHVALLPDLVSRQSAMSVELAVVQRDVAQLSARLEPLEQLPAKVAVLDSRVVDGVSPVQCEERRTACETQRKGRSTITVAQIQADASMRVKVLAIIGGLLAAGVGGLITWVVGQ